MGANERKRKTSSATTLRQQHNITTPLFQNGHRQHERSGHGHALTHASPPRASEGGGGLGLLFVLGDLNR